MDLEEFDGGRSAAALVKADPAFARQVREVLALFRELAGPACTDAALVSMTARVVYWRERHGLTVEDLKAACRQLARPDGLAGFTHGGELLAAFAQAVGSAFLDRKRREEAAKMRAEDAEAKAGAIRSDQVRAMVGGLLQSWGSKPKGQK